MKPVRFALVSVLALALAGCAAPILKKDEGAQIVDVNVTKTKSDMGTANLEEAVRYRTQNAAYRYSEQGAEKTLDVEITSMIIPGAAYSLLLSGNSFIVANVTLRDKTTGQAKEPFRADAVIAGMGGLIGAAVAGSRNPVEYEQRLTRMLAENIMKRIYGSERAELAATNKPTKRATPNYPIDYAAESKKFECRMIRAQIAAEKEEAEERQNTGETGVGPQTKLPEDCEGVG